MPGTFKISTTRKREIAETLTRQAEHHWHELQRHLKDGSLAGVEMDADTMAKTLQSLLEILRSPTDYSEQKT